VSSYLFLIIARHVEYNLALGQLTALETRTNAPEGINLPLQAGIFPVSSLILRDGPRALALLLANRRERICRAAEQSRDLSSSSSYPLRISPRT